MTEYIKKQFPLHWLVWNNNYEELNVLLAQNTDDKEMRDTRGRTPLMLAVTLGHLESVRVLLQHSTNVNTENRDGWNVVQEAVATGDPELLQLVLERRDYQRYTSRIGGIPSLLQKLKEAPDFYVEMKWEFTSWVPLVSRMCPSDTYKVYKQGSNVRIDTTLLGFDHTSWQRGNKTYIFKGRRISTPSILRCQRTYVFKLKEGAEGDSAVMMEVDHEKEEVYTDEMRTLSPADLQNKSGIWGWRSDKVEEVNGHDCKVFAANNVELVTKTRTEHLAEPDKAKAKTPKTPLQSFLGIAESEEKVHSPSSDDPTEITNVSNPCNITPEEYFSTDDLQGRDIGRPREINTKIQKFKATLWLAEKYPLGLQEQIMPIVDLMAISSSHFAKLKDFIQMQLPAGFPVKIEIPLFHVLNARITFGNIFGMDEDIPGVTRVGDEEHLSCVVDDSCFEPPAGYVAQGIKQLEVHVCRYCLCPCEAGGEMRRQFSIEEEDELLQFAIQQSLIDAGSEGDEVDIWEALKAQRPSRPTTPSLQAEEERQLQRSGSSSPILPDAHISRSKFNPLSNLFSRRRSDTSTIESSSSQLQQQQRRMSGPALFKPSGRRGSGDTDSLIALSESSGEAIQASLALYHRGTDLGGSSEEAAATIATDPTYTLPPLSQREPPDGLEAADADLQMALALSQQEREREERRRQEEEEMLEQVLRLSLTEK
ncbi:hypothetical protein B566_EDAN003503 [Ephemera danica]|nr:hypothetical protein B566_EDAN003503 [Ephemera danica]